MTCRFSDANAKCTIDEGIFDMPGVDENGVCVCEDDPDPTLVCEEYQSDEESY